MTAPDATSGSFYVFAKRLQTIAQTNKVALGLADIWYGDQQQIPRTPTLCIVPDGKTREIEGSPRRSRNNLKCYLLLYHSKIQDIQKNSEEVDQLAEALETLIHADCTLGGLVIHSLVTAIDAGEITRLVNTARTMFRASRLTVEGLSKTLLPLSPGYNQ
jgi:hypothetical protein